MSIGFGVGLGDGATAGVVSAGVVSAGTVAVGCSDGAGGAVTVSPPHDAKAMTDRIANVFFITLPFMREGLKTG
jgi:hypothetical protein